jgi:hypothetical protein
VGRHRDVVSLLRSLLAAAQGVATAEWWKCHLCSEISSRCTCDSCSNAIIQ